MKMPRGGNVSMERFPEIYENILFLCFTPPQDNTLYYIIVGGITVAILIFVGWALYDVNRSKHR